ncbi:hypothetical protein QUA26_20165 [Microcoleus sp. Pol12A4]|uniref:hypothetical protein n=1 Tax=Microcoleus sp. Pol8_C1 TaxID=2818896 RepID=UPI002FD245B9
MVSEPIDNGDRDADNCSFSLQETAPVWESATSRFCKWLTPQKWLGTVLALGR